MGLGLVGHGKGRADDANLSSFSSCPFPFHHGKYIASNYLIPFKEDKHFAKMLLGKQGILWEIGQVFGRRKFQRITQKDRKL